MSTPQLVAATTAMVAGKRRRTRSPCAKGVNNFTAGDSSVNVEDDSDSDNSSSSEKSRDRLELIRAQRRQAFSTENTPRTLCRTSYRFHVEEAAPMILIPYSKFREHGSIPRSSDRASLDMMSYDQLLISGKRPFSLVVFVSHRWLNPSLDASKMHPDKATGDKFKTIVKGMDSLLKGLCMAAEGVGKAKEIKKKKNIEQEEEEEGNQAAGKVVDEVYLWIDFCCIEQDDYPQLCAGVRSLAAYIERCDLVFTPYNEDCFDGVIDEATVEFQRQAAAVGSVRNSSCATSATHSSSTTHSSTTPTATSTTTDTATATTTSTTTSVSGAGAGTGAGGGSFTTQGGGLTLFTSHRTLTQYMSRGWCRLELFMASQCPLPPEGFGYFQAMGVYTRPDRPHVFFGDNEIKYEHLPEVRRSQHIIMYYE